MEALDPGSVALMAIYRKYSGCGGLAVYSPSDDFPTLERWERDILTDLGGKAAVETILGFHDVGVASDLDKAFRKVRRLVKETCVAGFRLHSRWDDSPQLQYDQEQAIAAEVEQYYRDYSGISLLRYACNRGVQPDWYGRVVLIGDNLDNIIYIALFYNKYIWIKERDKYNEVCNREVFCYV